jgi:hypothetical protein
MSISDLATPSEARVSVRSARFQVRTVKITATTAMSMARIRRRVMAALSAGFTAD